MSAENVLRHCGQFLSSLPLGDAALHDLSRVIKQVDHETLQLMYELSVYAGFMHDEACARVLPVLLQNCAIHLADDLADGDCHYLSKPMSQGATALFTLQQLFNLSLQKCALSDKQRRQCYKLLSLVGAARHAELSTEQWSLDKSMFAAKGLNGYQFEAYFFIVSANSEVHDQLQTLGHSYGIVNHLAHDIMSNDIRYTHLNEKEKAALRAWGMAHAKNVVEADIAPLLALLPSLLRHIR